MNVTTAVSRILVLVDADNITGAAWNIGRKIDWQRLLDYLVNYGDSRRLVEAVAYLGLPPRTPRLEARRESKERFADWLRSHGWLVVTKEGTPTEGVGFRANVDVMLGIDAIQLAVDMRPDIVVLVSGDNEFAFLATTLRRRGIRVEVAAIASSLSTQLRASANGVIDLTHVFDPSPSPSPSPAATVETRDGAAPDAELGV